MEIMSVKRIIPKIIPHEWDYVLRKNKVLSNFVNYVYRDVVLPQWKNYKKAKFSVNRIKHLVTNCPLTRCFNTSNTVEGTKFWEKIEQEINIYKEQCR